MLNAPNTTNEPESVLDWAKDAPKGGRAVMNRVLKEGASVPLFFAQTLIASLRDVGYNSTTSALCEHIDNAIQAGATEIRVYFRQEGKKGAYLIDAAVYDNGRGMAPNVLKVATSFGGSMNYNNRTGIGRFGMGMKTAALSMSPTMELYSWQEPGAFYNMILDVEAIGKERGNLVELPNPTLLSELRDDILDLLSRPMSFPSSAAEQELLLDRNDDPVERLGASGTIVYMPECDRLTSAKARTLVEHAVREMSRVYRRAIAGGLRLFVNNRRVEAFDPTYAMPNARHAKLLETEAKTSRLVVGRQIDIPLREGGEQTDKITVRIYRLPIEEWSSLSRKTQRNDLQVFNDMTVSILRNDREVFAGPMPELTTRHSVTNWYRVQIDFPGALDEAFGVAANKQGVRLKNYVMEALKKEFGDDISSLNEELKRYHGLQASARAAAKPTASELRATEADPFQAKPLAPLTSEEEDQLDQNLRALAVTLRRDGETDQQAFERVKVSKYLIEYKHDDFWPFYHVEHKFGRVILYINTAHPFFSELYDPIRKLSMGSNGENEQAQSAPTETQSGPIVALELLLLSLAKAQGQLAGASDDSRKLLETLRREWSESYRVQLTA
jgi:hypothetical protein